MPTSFPTARQALTPRVDDSAVGATGINAIQDTVMALEDKVGITSDTNTSSIDYKLSNRGSLGYAEATADQTLSTIADLTGLTVTVTVPAGGRRVRVTGFICSCTNDNNNTINKLFIDKDGATVAEGNVLKTITTEGGIFMTIFSEVPTAASHTYKLRASTSAGNVTFKMGAAKPGFILVESI